MLPVFIRARNTRRATHASLSRGFPFHKLFATRRAAHLTYLSLLSFRLEPTTVLREPPTSVGTPRRKVARGLFTRGKERADDDRSPRLRVSNRPTRRVGVGKQCTASCTSFIQFGTDVNIESSKGNQRWTTCLRCCPALMSRYCMHTW
jgi:hypothetical protein